MRERATKRGEADERQARAERRITRGVVDEGTGVPLTRRCGRFETCGRSCMGGCAVLCTSTVLPREPIPSVAAQGGRGS